MTKTETQGNMTPPNLPPPGYPTENPSAGKKGWFRTKKRGEKGFLEGCFAALCCCFVCEECCCCCF